MTSGMSGVMGDMGRMRGEGIMTPEEIRQMSKMMGDMLAALMRIKKA